MTPPRLVLALLVAVAGFGLPGNALALSVTGPTGGLRFWEYQSTDLAGAALSVSGRAAFSAQIPAGIVNNGTIIYPQRFATFREGGAGYTHGAALIRADFPDQNSGGRDQLIVGRNNQPLRSALSFDLSAMALCRQ